MPSHVLASSRRTRRRRTRSHHRTSARRRDLHELPSDGDGRGAQDRAYAVKPVGSYVKSNFESRACSGVNLGRCSSIPHAYNIWLPEQHKVIQTSEVYFDESLASQRRLGTPSPTSAPAADPSDISTGGVNPSSGTVPAPTAGSSLPEAFASATRDATSRIYSSTRLLLLFSGAYNRPDGLAQFARQLGLEVDMFDSDPNTGGGVSADITKEAGSLREAARERITRGDYAAIIAAPPCSTFSISRFFESPSASDGGPPPVRTRTEIGGCRFLPSGHRAELARANDVVNKMCSLLHLAHRAGSEVIIENLSDCGDLSRPNLFLNASHGPLWLMPAICALAKTATFAMCAFGAPWQKATTLLYTAGFDAWLDVLRERRCEHVSHAKRGASYVWLELEKRGAAYPHPRLQQLLAQAVAAMVKQRSTVAPVTPPPTTNSGPVVVTQETRGPRGAFASGEAPRARGHFTIKGRGEGEGVDAAPGSNAVDDALKSAQETIESKL